MDDEFSHFKVHFGWLQVLAECEYITAMSNQIVHCPQHFLLCFLPNPTWCPFWCVCRILLVRFICSRLFSYLAWGSHHSRYNWPTVPYIVRDYFLPCTDHSFMGLPVGFKYPNQGFNSGFWGSAVLLKKRSGTKFQLPYLELILINWSNHCMLLHAWAWWPSNPWLVHRYHIQWVFSCFDCTKEHDLVHTLPRIISTKPAPAFSHIGALLLWQNGVLYSSTSCRTFYNLH